ncbi:MAG: glycosyltransferase family 4 protein, partial [Candidatus Babeliales bacterium]
MFSIPYYRVIFIITLCSLLHAAIWNGLADTVHVIVITSRSSELGGTEMHNFVLYKILLSRGYSTNILVTPESKLETLFKSSGLPYATFSTSTSSTADNLVLDILPCCRQDRLNILICTLPRQLVLKEQLATYCKAKTIVTMHMPMDNYKKFNSDCLRHADAIVSANLDTLELVTKATENQEIRPVTIEHIFPFVDEDRYLHFSPKEKNRYAFFKSHGVEVRQRPVVTVIANMYKHVSEYKNFPLLFAAIKKIDTPVEVMMAGDGVQRPALEEMVRKMGLKRRIHFLGFIQDIPELLYHSDIHVLPSAKESFGLVHIEAAFLKKPSIGAHGTGADMIIKDGQTGLLFKNNDVDDLAKKIKLLITNQLLR